MKAAFVQFKRVQKYLPPGATRYIRIYVLISCLLTLLDVAALMLLALSLSSMLQGSEINIPVVNLSVGPDGYVWLILVVSCLILMKSALSLAQQWAATRKFTEFELGLGLRLFDAYIGAPWVVRLGRTSSRLVRMADVGVSAVVSGLILPIIALPASLLSSVLILVTLAVVRPLTAAIAVVYLGLIAYLLSAVLTRRAVVAGRVNRDYSYKVASLMTDMVGALKEITLRNKFDEVAEEVRRNRKHAARARANIQFLGSVPKFVMDAALIGGFLLVGVISFVLTHDMNEAISAVVLFAVGAMRLIPTLINLQTTNNNLNANQAQIRAVLRDMEDAEDYKAQREVLGKEPLDGDPQELRLKSVSFMYPTGEEPAVRDVSMTIKLGTRVGLVGESGSGKSTLVDIILGLLEPQEGSVMLDNQRLSDVLAAWRSRVGYVPQDVSLFDGSVAQNVALTWQGTIDREKVIECLKRAQLWDAIEKRPGGLDAGVGERGMGFSGGQRQRLGIARALYSDPYILIMDEATSALDTKTEAEVSKAIRALHGDVTVISVAHRLSTVKDVDQLFFMEDGLLLASGTFDEVVREVPTFREQARLAGLVADAT
ncbi:ABC transporter ATP-binding protein [Schaalia sp. JY-X169]|uniref:ABC transporter ATP-binding protein n=1 Tax=Schaalia sp. JY-X169 TaxID=2758572 RepID=UPI0015F5DEE5|nr:ABC transporter ATP-binding protein [Schaalia sp. JY-X169]